MARRKNPKSDRVLIRQLFQINSDRINDLENTIGHLQHTVQMLMDHIESQKAVTTVVEPVEAEMETVHTCDSTGDRFGCLKCRQLADVVVA